MSEYEYRSHQEEYAFVLPEGQVSELYSCQLTTPLMVFT